jgi:signal transduction histidine kinase
MEKFMKNYEAMSKTELIREIADLLEKQKKESGRAKKKISRLQGMIEEPGFDLEDRVRKEVGKKAVEERFLLHESGLIVMEELVGNVAHQWRQPLNIVGLSVQKLQFDFERNEVNEGYMNEMVNEVLDTVKQMSRTVQKFRDFMQIDRKRQEFNLNDTLHTVLSFVDASMKSAGISVMLDAVEEDQMVNGYRNELCRIMLNMLNNSRKVLLMNKIENPLIAIRLFPQDSRCVISIHDNGGCVTEQAIDEMFEPYSSSVSRGTVNSMGLHMSKAIIERKMNGKFTASNSEKGVEFRIELQRAG